MARAVPDVDVNPAVPAAGSGGDLLGGLLRRVTAQRPDADTGLITKAYAVAASWHHGQQRYSGDPYITHPVAVAAILAGAAADDQMVCAGLLHDVAEDTTCTVDELRREFGGGIADLVAATMALDPVRGDQALQTAVALPGGDRALVIKLADRLHNMRTLRYLPRTKQVLKAQQTLDVIVPIASTLRHMDEVTAELESLATATLRQRGQRPGMASGRLLAAATALLPAGARARWRDEWLGELHQLPTRRQRVDERHSDRSCDDRTRRLTQLIQALRNTPPQAR